MCGHVRKSRKCAGMIKFLVMALAFVMVIAARLLYAGEAPTMGEHPDFLWQIIVGLFALLNTILTAILIWIISNQKELFQRVGHLETGLATVEVLCDERHQVDSKPKKRREVYPTRRK